MKLTYYLSGFLLIGLIILNGCFPERQPFEPEELETRRPNVAFIVPDDEAVVAPGSVVSVWFDELMNQETVKTGFTLTLAVERQPWYEIKQPGSIAQNPLNPDQMILGLVDHAVFSTASAGETWQFLYPLAYSKILDFQYDPQQEGRIYALQDSAILKTENQGVSWQEITNGLPAGVQVTCFSINPQNSAQVWLGTSQGLFKSENSGEMWQLGGTLPQWTNQVMTQIAFNPVNSLNIFVTTLGRYLYASSDGGVTWEMKRGTTNRLPASRLYDVVVNKNEQIFVATINSGIYKSTDGGENWNAINVGISDLNTRQIYLAPTSIDRLFAATASQLFVSENAGESWRPIQMPNPGESFVDLNADPQIESRLFLATNSGIYLSEDLGNTWQSRNQIDVASLTVEGSFVFESWQGQLEFFREEGDTLIIEPHRENDALAAYDAGLIKDPPVEPNPVATFMKFTPGQPLMANWLYQIKVDGGFQANVWQPGVGVKDLQGNSLEIDQIQYFEVTEK